MSWASQPFRVLVPTPVYKGLLRFDLIFHAIAVPFDKDGFGMM